MPGTNYELWAITIGKEITWYWVMEFLEKPTPEKGTFSTPNNYFPGYATIMGFAGVLIKNGNSIGNDKHAQKQPDRGLSIKENHY